MNNTIESERLLLNPVTLDDFNFIKTLVNTDGWIQFIGNRNINTIEDAKNYITRIIENKEVTYWVVKTKNTNTSIGIITFIKRDYLEFHDLGFAFLPEFGKNGYAYEASSLVINMLKSNKLQKTILATTIPENSKSILLLEKLGFTFQEKIENNAETLAVYKNHIL